jgi:hypothetical protein
MSNETDIDTRGARMRVPRSRGAVSGLLLILLGAWGALIPLIGPYVHFGFTPDTAWHFSSGRFWLEILPGAVAAIGGFLLLTAASRLTTSFGAWLGVAAGAWFVIGTPLGTLFNLGSVGAPIATSKFGKAIQFLLLLDGLGALIIFVAATALGRLGVVSVRDVQAARRREEKDRDDMEPVRRPVRETSVQTPVRSTEPATRAVVTDADTARSDVPPASPNGGATSLNSHR